MEGLKAVLALEDGSVWVGKGFGRPKRVVGEVVFNTGMVGYTEALTDPSYKGQILVMTYPLIGNYGVPSYSLVDEFGLPLHFESLGIKVNGLVVYELCERPSHHLSVRSLGEWMYDEGVPGISGIDTRELTKRLREKGVMMGALEVSEDPSVDSLLAELKASKRYEEQRFVEQVTVEGPEVLGEGVPIALIDCGVKLGIVRSLLERGFKVIRLPYNVGLDELMAYRPKGVLISNGPGNPELLKETIELVSQLMDEGIPILGICLGNQLLALASGAKSYKLKYGHRGQNKPCVELESGRSYVTSQNHGYAVDKATLGKGFKVWWINADDKTVEGIRHESKPFMAVQYHPEASPGPYDTLFIFDLFREVVMKA